jgi:hypothetical protein
MDKYEALVEAYNNFKGDISHHWNCELEKDNTKKCDCGAWALEKALAALEDNK